MGITTVTSAYNDIIRIIDICINSALEPLYRATIIIELDLQKAYDIVWIVWGQMQDCILCTPWAFWIPHNAVCPHECLSDLQGPREWCPLGTLWTSVPLSTWMTSRFSCAIPRTQPTCMAGSAVPTRKQTFCQSWQMWVSCLFHSLSCLHHGRRENENQPR